MTTIVLDDGLKIEKPRHSLTHDRLIAGMAGDEADWRAGTVTKKNKPMYDNIPQDQVYHNGYMEYLETCWNSHYGVVLSPDIVWQGLLCELAAIVAKNPQKYRSLFTTTNEGKQELSVYSDSFVVMPIEALTDLLKQYVPSNSDVFLPRFSTTTERSFHAFSAAFCDICSPYYEYSMYMCGIPFIRLDGTEEDWTTLLKSWSIIGDMFQSESKFFVGVIGIISKIINQFSTPDVDFWHKMFSLKHCGSGSNVEVEGWIRDLYLVKPSPRYPENYATHISSVKYKQLNTGKKYDMRVGLFSSELQGQLLVPDFSFAVMETLDEPIVTKLEKPKLEIVTVKVGGNK